MITTPILVSSNDLELSQAPGVTISVTPLTPPRDGSAGLLSQWFETMATGALIAVVMLVNLHIQADTCHLES
jgi:hypothetical protein